MTDKNGHDLHVGDWVFTLGMEPSSLLGRKSNDERVGLGQISRIPYENEIRIAEGECWGSWSSEFVEFASEDDRIIYLLEM
jgi:hypothetical protein